MNPAEVLEGAGFVECEAKGDVLREHRTVPCIGSRPHVSRGASMSRAVPIGPDYRGSKGNPCELPLCSAHNQIGSRRFCQSVRIYHQVVVGR